MAKYVNLDDMLEQFDKRASKLVGDRQISVESMREFICNRPRANVKEIVYAHWIPTEYPFMNECEDCSNCGYRTWYGNGYNYCPNCGARMEEYNEPEN